MKYFKRGHYGHCGYLYILPVNLDESSWRGFKGGWKYCIAAYDDLAFMHDEVRTILDKYYDEELNKDHRITTRLKFDNNMPNYYTIDNAEALTSEMEEYLKVGNEVKYREFMEELCLCMREVLKNSKGYNYILFDGP